jgi:hypothetical protein
MPANVGGPLEFTRRKDLANHIRYELEFLGWPKSLIRQVNLTALWHYIEYYGSSGAYFSIYYKGNALEFHGLTEEEFAQQHADQELGHG